MSYKDTLVTRTLLPMSESKSQTRIYAYVMTHSRTSLGLVYSSRYLTPPLMYRNYPTISLMQTNPTPASPSEGGICRARRHTHKELLEVIHHERDDDRAHKLGDAGQPRLEQTIVFLRHGLVGRRTGADEAREVVLCDSRFSTQNPTNTSGSGAASRRLTQLRAASDLADCTHRTLVCRYTSPRAGPRTCPASRVCQCQSDILSQFSLALRFSSQVRGPIRPLTLYPSRRSYPSSGPSSTSNYCCPRLSSLSTRQHSPQL